MTPEPSERFNGWSPYTGGRKTHRPSVVKVSAASTKTNYVAWNRRRKTASIKDIEESSVFVTSDPKYVIEEVNLELKAKK